VIDQALAALDFRRATSAVWDLSSQANRFVSETRPWELAKAAQRGDHIAAARLDAILTTLLGVCSCIGRELQPFLPDAAERIRLAVTDLDAQQGPEPLHEGDNLGCNVAVRIG
jgi:methionyl-tRNA synthetase